MVLKCQKYGPGDLSSFVTFERMTRTSDGSGGWSTTWATITGAPTRAKIKAKSGGERFASERVEASAQFMIACRYFAGLTDADRVSFDGKAHNIRFINNMDFSDKWFEIDVSGGVAS
jgi:SPP1 family predicted phage head-tail adaptor